VVTTTFVAHGVLGTLRRPHIGRRRGSDRRAARYRRLDVVSPQSANSLAVSRGKASRRRSLRVAIGDFALSFDDSDGKRIFIALADN
jgi:hypothetical protein